MRGKSSKQSRIWTRVMCDSPAVDALVGGDSGWHTGSGWPLFALGISRCSDKHFRNVPQSDPLAPAQLTCWAIIGSSGGQLSENTAFAIYSPLCSRLQLSPAVCLAIVQTRWLIPYVRPSPCRHHKNNVSLAAQWEPVRARRPRFLGDRHDMQVRDATFRVDSCYSAKLLVWGKQPPGYCFYEALWLFVTAFTPQCAWCYLVI